MNIQIDINAADMTNTGIWRLFRYVLSMANEMEVSDPQNDKFNGVRESLTDARALIHGASGLLDHACAAVELGRAFEMMTGDKSLREQAKVLMRQFLDQENAR